MPSKRKTVADALQRDADFMRMAEALDAYVRLPPGEQKLTREVVATIKRIQAPHGDDFESRYLAINTLDELLFGDRGGESPPPEHRHPDMQS